MAEYDEKIGRHHFLGVGEDNPRLSEQFQQVGQLVPLGLRDIIPIGNQYNDQVLDPRQIGANNHAVSFRHILETGEVFTSFDNNFLQAWSDGLTLSDFYGQAIDWESDDAYTRALETIYANVIEGVENDPALQDLLAQESWDMEDRMAWEEGLSTIVMYETHNIPGLEEYRHTGRFFVGPYEERTPLAGELLAERRALTVNDLAQDIESGEHTIEFDCETMSITKGVIQQRVEEFFLPGQMQAPNELRSAQAYFYTTGDVAWHTEGRPYTDPGGHAFIVSAATGAVIEGTSIYDPYERPLFGSSFEDFVSGEAFMSTHAFYWSGLPGRIGLNEAQTSYYYGLAGELSNLTTSIVEQRAQLEQIPEFQALETLVERWGNASIEERTEMVDEIEALINTPDLRPALEGFWNDVNALSHNVRSFDAVIPASGMSYTIGIDFIREDIPALLHATNNVPDPEFFDVTDMVFEGPDIFGGNHIYGDENGGALTLLTANAQAEFDLAGYSADDIFYQLLTPSQILDGMTYADLEEQAQENSLTPLPTFQMDP